MTCTGKDYCRFFLVLSASITSREGNLIHRPERSYCFHGRFHYPTSGVGMGGLCWMRIPHSLALFPQVDAFMITQESQ